MTTNYGKTWLHIQYSSTLPLSMWYKNCSCQYYVTNVNRIYRKVISIVKFSHIQ